MLMVFQEKIVELQEKNVRIVRKKSKLQDVNTQLREKVRIARLKNQNCRTKIIVINPFNSD